ncbi:MAG: acyl-CoA carboxylase subunit epsilon [Actinomycetota bacterium]|nr:acyl-CoA carboxylase subunit epsilon [Actinomycetota bacterium]
MADDDTLYDIRIAGGTPSDEEIAAVTAVLSAALEELAGDHRRRQRLTPSAWERSQRSVRTPLSPGTWMTYGS